MTPKSAAELESFLLRSGRPLASFKKGDRIRGTSTMALKPYSYVLEESPGLSFAEGFKPELTPGEILMLGAFEGAYLNDCYKEFPAEWFLGGLMTGSLSPGHPNQTINLFGVKSRQPLSVWKQNGWAPSTAPPSKDHYKGVLSHTETNPDERGWFQWYCRYWMGRRIPELDRIQINRWRSFARHAGAIRANCKAGDLTCRPRERQALLQWAWSPFL